MSRRLMAAVAVAVLAVAGCRVVYDSSSTLTLTTRHLTGSGDYALMQSPGHAAFSSAAADGNIREVIYPAGAESDTNSESCATWTSSSGVAQQGAAFRIHATKSGWRAITVTKNIIFGAYWIFNFHTWDTTNATPFAQFGWGVDLSTEFEIPGSDPKTVYDLPWKLCATVNGSNIQFKAWRASEPEPSYGDPRFGATATIPAGWAAGGITGWYIGHLPQGGTATFDGLVTKAA